MAGTLRRADPIGELSDREILEFLAAHSFGIVEQVATPSRISKEQAYGRLAALWARGLVSEYGVTAGQPGLFVITRAGLDVFGSELGVPTLELADYRREVAAGWLWCWARDGMLGRVGSFLSRRQMRGTDGAVAAGDGDGAVRGDHRRAPFAVRVGPGPGELHYPDLMLIDRVGRVAVLLLLDPLPVARLEVLLGAYAADRRIAAVLVLSAHPAVTATVVEVVARLRLGDLVVAQPVAVVLPGVADARRTAHGDGRRATDLAAG